MPRSPRRARKSARSSSRTRAIAIRWRWPPDSLTPRSPTNLSYPLRPVGSMRLDHEVVRGRLSRRPTPPRSSLRPAIQDVLADRTVQQGRVLRDHADLPAQAVLGRRGDVLPVDQDAPALDVRRNAKGSSASVGLPAPERPTSPTFSPARRERKIVDPPRRPCRSGIARSRTGLRTSARLASVASATVGQRPRARDRSAALLHLCPTLSKMPIEVHITQPDIKRHAQGRTKMPMSVSRRAKAPCAQSQTAMASQALTRSTLLPGGKPSGSET